MRTLTESIHILAAPADVWRCIEDHAVRIQWARNCIPQLHQRVAPGGKFSSHEARKTLPIRGFQGLKDRYLKMIMNPSWRAALSATKQLGYGKVDRVDLPDKAHVDCAKEVTAWFDELRRATR